MEEREVDIIEDLGASCSRIDEGFRCAMEKACFDFACPMDVYLCPPRLNIFREFLQRCKKIHFPDYYYPDSCKEEEIFLKDLVKEVSKYRDPEEQELTLLAILSKYWWADDVNWLLSHLPDGWWGDQVAKALLIAFVTQGLYP